jgi:putative hydrolase of the HAD superfamily
VPERALKAVTFDFWGTLFKWSGRTMEIRKQAVRRFVADHRGELSAEVVDQAFQAGLDAGNTAWKESRHFGPEAVIEHLFAELRLEAPAEARAELRALLEDPEPGGVLAPIEGVAASVADLRSRGLRLGIVCDSGMMVGRVLRDRLQRSGLAPHFEPAALAFSDEVGVTKPRPEIFLRSLVALGVGPGEAAHVGDLHFTDMAGAKALGMRAVRFKGFNDDHSEGPEGDAVIDSYDDLSAALGLYPPPWETARD